MGDLRAVSVSQTNMGMLAQVRGQLVDARDRFVEAHALADEVGDLLADGRRPAQPGQRDAGPGGPRRGRRVLPPPSSTRTPNNDDRWSLAHLFEDVAVWLLARGPAGDAEAVSLLAAAESLREEIGGAVVPAPPRPRWTRPLLQLASAPRPRSSRRRPSRAEPALARGNGRQGSPRAVTPDETNLSGSVPWPTVSQVSARGSLQTLLSGTAPLWVDEKLDPGGLEP